MPLLGHGMLMTFTEVPDDVEQDFNEWYNREHIDERTPVSYTHLRAHETV